MIKLNCVFFDGKKEIEDEGLSFRGQNSPLTKLAMDIVSKVELLDSFKNPVFKGEKIFDNTNCKIDAPVEDIEIDIVFINRDEDLLDYWAAPEDIVGLHCLNSGAFESSDGDFLSTKHRVVVTIDEKDFKQSIYNNRESLRYGQNDKSQDEMFLKLYMNTITHELGHCLEWIENTNGLTPSQVQNLIESDEIFADFNDIITGDGIIFEKGLYGSDDELEDVMENRVENKGMEWLNSIDIDKKLIKNALTLSNKKKNKINP